MKHSRTFFFILSLFFVHFSLTSGQLKVGEECTKQADCPVNSKCSIFGYCQCTSGYKSTPEGSCKRLECTSGIDCRRLMPNSECINSTTGSSYCECLEDYAEDEELLVCSPTKRRLGESCEAGSGVFDCGEGARCVSPGLCYCLTGSRPLHDDEDAFRCEKINCGDDDDCVLYDMNTKCFDGECRCRSGYGTDKDSIRCQKEWPIGKAILLIVAATVGVAFVGAAIVFGIREARHPNYTRRWCGR